MLVTALSTLLRLNSPPLVLPRAGFDDAMFAHLAWRLLNREWLGPYGFATLTKGPGYPMFIALAYRLHMPLKLAEHGLRLMAVGVLALAVARISHERWLGVATYFALALDPSYFGLASSHVARDGFYGTVSLLLVGAILLVFNSVPELMRRGPPWALPALAAAGAGIGVIAATYYLTREERVWLAPTALAAGIAAMATWRRDGARRLPLCGAATLVVLVASATCWWAVDQVRDRNEAAYDTRTIGSLSEGGAARAYVEWQRVDLGPVLPWVTVNSEQRRAAYRVSPAAAEVEAHLEGSGTRWIGPECTPPLPAGCEYPGGSFNWVLMEAAWATGHEPSGAEADAFFNRMADEIATACDDGRLPCVEPGVGMLPPLDRLDTSRLWPSLHHVTTYLFSFDYAEPGESRLSTGTPQEWNEMLRPLRGLDETQDQYDALARRAAERQQAVSALTDVYRWAARLGLFPALAGLALAVATPMRRTYWRSAVVGAVLLLAVISRIGVLTIVDAVAFDTRYGVYHLPATGFLVAFLVISWWLLAKVVADMVRRQEASAGERGRAAQVEPEVDGDERLDSSPRSDGRLVPR